jgi:hypothetical protein
MTRPRILCANCYQIQGAYDKHAMNHSTQQTVVMHPHRFGGYGHGDHYGTDSYEAHRHAGSAPYASGWSGVTGCHSCGRHG